jgi:hypothetical protein
MAESASGFTSCTRCGARIDTSARFCVQCGAAMPGGSIGREIAKTQRTTGARAQPPPPRSAKSGGAGTSRVASQRRTLQLDVGATVGAPSSPPADADRTAASMTQALAEVAAPSPAPPPVDGGSQAAPIAAILDDIDSTFDNILQDPRRVSQESRPDDMEQAQALFRQITVAYIGPIRDFMIELRMGEPSKEWIQVCAPALASLSASAERMGLSPLASALGELRTALEAAETGDSTNISENAREQLLAASHGLATLLPEAFAVDEERDRREPIIVRSLLCQVPGVRKVQLDKLYRAGLTSLSMYYVAKPSELAQTTGLAHELCEQIVKRFARYKSMASIPPDPQRSNEVSQLERLAERLSELNDAFERGGTVGIDKKRARQERGEVMLEISVVLARLGEVGLVETLERLPFQRKVEAFGAFITKRRAEQMAAPISTART